MAYVGMLPYIECLSDPLPSKRGKDKVVETEAPRRSSRPTTQQKTAQTVRGIFLYGEVSLTILQQEGIAALAGPSNRPKPKKASNKRKRKRAKPPSVLIDEDTEDGEFDTLRIWLALLDRYHQTL